MRARSALPVMLVLVALTSCTISQPSSYPDPRVITALRATRPADREHGIPPFDHRGDDAAKVQRFYAAMLALPGYPQDHALPCHQGIGGAYDLVFISSGTVAHEAQAHADGCQVVTMARSGGHTYDVRQIDGGGFWSLLADALGVPESQIYPVPPAPLPS